MRRLPIGAEVHDAGTHFRVWAPRRAKVEAVMDGGAVGLESEGNGYFSALAPSAGAGTLYRFRLDGKDEFPDPASRFQPEGPHGPSQVVDPRTFRWNDRGWSGVRKEGQVLYEMHVGTFTREGTWAAARAHLAELAALGITVIEVMPVAEFPGRFGWGYDGVDLYAPTRLYGSPDDFRAFVDCAHGEGLGVILDVVYNHLGPDGNYLKEFAPAYFTDRYKNEWGEPINFDGDDAAPVREFFVANAGYWIDEFHLDGLRLDATQQIFDASPRHILEEIGERVRKAARGRATYVVAENEPQLAKIARPVAHGGYGLDALWNDDFHHSTHVALTGHNEAYYSGYRGTPQELVSALKRGFLFQGQRYAWQAQRRGTPAFDLAPAAFVHYIQNHDQVANSATGLRVHALASPGRLRALTAVMLLVPQTPMLFQGQEFAASSPFLFFADHEPALARLVKKGRAEFLMQFPGVAAMREALDDPGDPETFERCKLDHAERDANAHWLALHRDLIALRREDPVFSAMRAGGLDGAVIAGHAFALRFVAAGGDRLVLANLGADLAMADIAEPLVAPPEGHEWKLAWSSEDPRYGGAGAIEVEAAGAWRIPGEAAVVLVPHPAAAERRGSNRRKPKERRTR